MRTLLRRAGILVFAGLSFFTWIRAADTAGMESIGASASAMFVLTGASLACLAGLLLAELTSWSARLLDHTRQETVLAEIDFGDEVVFVSMKEAFPGWSDWDPHAQDHEQLESAIMNGKERVDRVGRAAAELARS